MKLQVRSIYQAEVLTRVPYSPERTKVVRRSRFRFVALLAARFAAFRAQRTLVDGRANWRVAQVPTWNV